MPIWPETNGKFIHIDVHNKDVVDDFTCTD